MTKTSHTRMVGVDLQENEENRGVIEAIEADNADLTIRHMPGIVKLMTPDELVIRRSTVERLLGRPWETHEFQLAIVSYSGHISEWDDDEIVIRWDH